MFGVPAKITFKMVDGEVTHLQTSIFIVSFKFPQFALIFSRFPTYAAGWSNVAGFEYFTCIEDLYESPNLSCSYIRPHPSVKVYLESSSHTIPGLSNNKELHT